MSETQRHSHLVKISVPVVFQIQGYNRNNLSDTNAEDANDLGELATFANTPSAKNEVKFLYPQITSAPENMYLDLKFRTDEATDLKLQISPTDTTYDSDTAKKFTQILRGDTTTYWTVVKGATGLTLRGLDVKKIITLLTAYNFSLFFLFDRNPVDADFHIDRLRCFGNVDLGSAYGKH